MAGYPVFVGVDLPGPYIRRAGATTPVRSLRPQYGLIRDASYHIMCKNARYFRKIMTKYFAKRKFWYKELRCVIEWLVESLVAV